MSKHFAFIRGISVGGHAAVHMSELKQAFLAAGCSNVATFVQSGNVALEVDEEQLPSIGEAITRELGKVLGDPPAVMLRTSSELRRMVKSEPFAPLAGDADTKLYVAFLAAKPRRTPEFPLRSSTEALEAIGMRGKDVFIVSRRKENGAFGFPNDFIEKQLGVSATTRDWPTVSKMAAMEF
jgi:uncharacterized protein (DUF1697 family)